MAIRLRLWLALLTGGVLAILKTVASVRRRAWESPSGCGCTLKIAARWTGTPVLRADGYRVALRHPVPGSIWHVSIVQVCAAHRAWLTAPLPNDPHFGCVGYLGRKVSGAHGLVLPDRLSAAARLYAHLFRYTRLVWTPDTCACSVVLVTDRAEPGHQIIAHWHYSSWCEAHVGIEGHYQALAENVAKNEALAAIGRVVPRLVYSAEDAASANRQAVGLPAHAADSIVDLALRQRGLKPITAGTYRVPVDAHFDASRRLHVRVPVTAEELARVRALVQDALVEAA